MTRTKNRRYLINMPCPVLGGDVVYHSVARAEPFAAKITSVRTMPDEDNPTGAVVDLVVFASDGTLYLYGVEYGHKAGRWSFPPARPSPFTFAVNEVDCPDAPDIPEGPDDWQRIIGAKR